MMFQRDDSTGRVQIMKKHPVLTIAVIVLIAAAAVVFAKYIAQKTSSTSVASNEMYFTSDLLSEKGSSYTLRSGTDSITVELRNYEDSLRWSGADISYTFTVKKQGSDGVLQTKTGTIARSSDEGSAASVTADGLASGTYEVTATAESPFTKTLTGRFTIPAESSDIDYSISDSAGSAYVLLTVSSKNYSGDVKLDWDKGLIPDSTQEAFSAVKTLQNGSYTAGSTTVAVKAYSSYTYRFFKEDITKDYSKSDSITAKK